MRLAPRAAALLLACSTAFTTLGCNRDREPRTSADWVGMLRSPEWKERRKAAHELRDDGGPPAEALPYLFAAIQYEQNPKAYEELLITLGASGAAEAKPLIDARVQDPDEDIRDAARDALKLWLMKNSLMGEDDDLPPPPHPFYGPVHVPPGAPASRPMLVPVPGPPPPPPGAAPPPGALPPPPPPPADDQTI